MRASSDRHSVAAHPAGSHWDMEIGEGVNLVLDVLKLLSLEANK
jgi:hypothetical protein